MKVFLKSLFELRGDLPRRTQVMIEIFGILSIVFVWWAITYLGNVRPGILPAPQSVLGSFSELHYQDFLLRNLGYSIKINFLGYLEALAISVPLGFLMGIFPLFKALFGRLIATGRFLPLTAVIGLFILWFGIGTSMKVHFLALGIAVYLIPVVVERVMEVEQVFVDTARTLGASDGQIVRKIFWPIVVSRLSTDIRVLIAISWTYIIIAEVVNRSEGGVGALIFTVARQSRVDKVFAILVVIVTVGFLQDRILAWIDKRVFPFKYIGTGE